MITDDTVAYRILKLLGQNTLFVLILQFVMFKIVFMIFVFIGIEYVIYLRNLTPLNVWSFQ